MPDPGTKREPLTLVTADALRRQVDLILEAWGMAPDDRAAVVEMLVETDLRGIESHGASMLPLYDRMRRAGGLNLRPHPRIVRDGEAFALLDADAGLGHPAAIRAVTLAVDKAERMGVGAVAVRNSHHFGAAGLYAEMAARRGCIALVTSSARTVAVIPEGGAAPVLGTNPIAFAAPATGRDPFLLDMSTSAVAANKVKVYSYHDTPLPVGWVVDGAGRPVTDPHRGLQLCFDGEVGGLMPLGGGRETGSHKGYGLAVMAQLLGSTLAGGSFSPFRAREAGPGAPDNIGHFVLALKPSAFRDGDAFQDEAAAILEALEATPPADPDRPVLVAGTPEFRTRAARMSGGIPLNGAFLDAVREVAAGSGVPFLLAGGA